MEYQNMNIRLNKEKSIGKVLFIVEGGRTEPFLLHRIFCKILDYQMETILRDKGYHKYNSKTNLTSQVFVINAEESNIKYIAKDNQFLNNLFVELIENYDFDVDNAAIYYLFDRDNQSNSDDEFIRELLSVLVNARDNDGYDRQGMLLLSYPSIEAFTLSNFAENSFQRQYKIGADLKQDLHNNNYNQSRISEESLLKAMEELLNAFMEIGITEWDIDAFGECNRTIFEFEEMEYSKEGMYRALSLLCISLIDLGLLEIK